MEDSILNGKQFNPRMETNIRPISVAQCNVLKVSQLEEVCGGMVQLAIETTSWCSCRMSSSCIIFSLDLLMYQQCIKH
jgi:hypothetical protein